MILAAVDSDFLLWHDQFKTRVLASDTALAEPKSDEGWSPYIDNPEASGLVATKSELREYKCVYVQSDAEIGLFSDEVVVNCAP